MYIVYIHVGKRTWKCFPGLASYPQTLKERIYYNLYLASILVANIITQTEILNHTRLR